jgi:hypothetical protein
VQKQGALPPSRLHRNHPPIISQNNVAVHHDDERRLSGGAKIALQISYDGLLLHLIFSRRFGPAF